MKIVFEDEFFWCTDETLQALYELSTLKMKQEMHNINYKENQSEEILEKVAQHIVDNDDGALMAIISDSTRYYLDECGNRRPNLHNIFSILDSIIITKDGEKREFKCWYIDQIVDNNSEFKRAHDAEWAKIKDSR